MPLKSEHCLLVLPNPPKIIRYSRKGSLTHLIPDPPPPWNRGLKQATSISLIPISSMNEQPQQLYVVCTTPGARAETLVHRLTIADEVSVRWSRVLVNAIHRSAVATSGYLLLQVDMEERISGGRISSHLLVLEADSGRIVQDMSLPQKLLPCELRRLGKAVLLVDRQGTYMRILQ
jgi:hypothetical protein